MPTLWCSTRMSVDDLGRLLVHLISHLLRDHSSRAERAGVEGDQRRFTCLEQSY